MRFDLMLLLTVPVMIAVGQLLFKMASRNLSGDLSRDLFSIAFQPPFIAAIALYGVASFLWVIAVQNTDISRAYPFMASGFIIVPFLGYLMFDETLTLPFFLGTALIVAGIAVIGQA
jgi:drug/metabolite transporter (DMT)-like permease